MDWQLTCRVCLESGDMVSLFDWDENNEQLGDKYTYCCGVEVSKNDSLPTLICLNCVDRLTYAYLFKQQCITSNETLKECLEEFKKSSEIVSASNSSNAPTETETITIKQENGLLLQYELPVEHDPQGQWTRTLVKTPATTVVTKAPGPRKRGRPRKYPNEQGQIELSPYQRKKPKSQEKERESLTTLLATGSLELKEEPLDEDSFGVDEFPVADEDDPDFAPEEENESGQEDKETILDHQAITPDKCESSTGKSYKKYDELLIEQALKEYKSTEQSLMDIAKKYNISKSVLHRHNVFVMKKQGGQPAVAPDVEDYVINYINVCLKWGCPLEAIDFRLLIKGHLDNLGVDVKRFKNNMPGPDYTKCFMKRHESKIASKLNQNIERFRAPVSPEIIDAYFDELEMLLKRIPLCNIVNYNEINLVDDPRQKRVLVKRSVKYPERVMNHTKGSTSVMMAASANGTLLPPYVVYKAQNVNNKWRQNGPKGCCYNCTNSGWFDAITFEDWMKTVAFNYFKAKSGTKILIGDNLVSRLSIKTISECVKLNVRFIFLPANSTHLTQPLDVAFLKPLTNAWQDILCHWTKTDGRIQAIIPKNIFPSLLKRLMEEIECSSQQNITAGFEKCGISPMDRRKVLDRLASTEDDEPA